MPPPEGPPASPEVLSGPGLEVYAAAVEAGALEVTDPVLRGLAHQHALTHLLDLGLLRQDPETRRYHPVDPQPAVDRLVTDPARRGSELLAESAQWNDPLGRLRDLYRSRTVDEAGALLEIEGIERINRFIDEELRACHEELLTAQPYGARSAETLAQAEPRDVAALSRGVAIRTIYQHSARHSPATRAYVAEVAALGAQVRTSDDFFKRLIIFDRKVALIPAAENHHAAMVVRERSVVAYLLDMFERAWTRALPFDPREDPTQGAAAQEVRSMVLRMLLAGYSDTASAKRLGVSARTYASYIAALKEEYAVETRFQLGWAISRSAGPELVLPAAGEEGRHNGTRDSTG